MPRYRLSGDILHPGIVEVEADSPEEAIDKAEDYGDFTIDDEQNKPLVFQFDGGAIFDENGEVEWGTSSPAQASAEPEIVRYLLHIWGSETAADPQLRSEGARHSGGGTLEEARQHAQSWLSAGDHISHVDIIGVQEVPVERVVS